MRRISLVVVMFMMSVSCTEIERSGVRYRWTYLVCGSGGESNDCAPVAQFTDERSCLSHLRLANLYCNFADARDGVIICREDSSVSLPASLRSSARCVPTGVVS